LKDIDGLLAQQPNNPYLHEMKGEILLKARQPKKAAASFAKAAKLDRRNSGIIQAQLGFAYLSTGEPAQAKKAIKELRAALSSDPYNFAAYDYLSRAYAQNGDIANAELTQAEGNFIAGNIDDAKRFAIRALMKLPKGTPAWQRADDIVKYNKPKKK
jgi:predicted Zn-dependent protease